MIVIYITLLYLFLEKLFVLIFNLITVCQGGKEYHNEAVIAIFTGAFWLFGIYCTFDKLIKLH